MRELGRKQMHKHFQLFLTHLDIFIYISPLTSTPSDGAPLRQMELPPAAQRLFSSTSATEERVKATDSGGKPLKHQFKEVNREINSTAFR